MQKPPVAFRRHPARVAALALAVASFFTHINAAYPEFTSTQPRGAQRGSEVKITVFGNRLSDFESLVFYSPGFTQKSVDRTENNQVDVTIEIAPNTPLGNHLFRVRTRSGVSHGRQFFVGPFPNVSEVEPNSDFSNAQSIPLESTVEGVVKTEDVDYYKIRLKSGQRLSVEVEGLRLGYLNFDPYLAILDQNRFEKSFSDDSVLFRQDGYCSYVAEADGDYYVMVRESSYRGGDTSFYRLHVGSFRRPDVVYPAGGPLGSTIKVRFIEGSDHFEEEITLPSEQQPAFLLFSTHEQSAPSGNPFRLAPFDNVLETEPNNEPTQATVCTPSLRSLALNGVISEPGDLDYFQLELKKGANLELTTMAQSIGSPLDSVIQISNAKGERLADNDDGGGVRRLDSRLKFTIPEEGVYHIRIGDHLHRGGPQFVYRVEIVSSQPELTFSAPNYNINDTHYRQFVALPRGGRMAHLVNLNRSSVSGDFEFQTNGLPPGVRLVQSRVPGSYPNFPLVFEAAADAPLAHAVVPITLKSTDPTIQVVGHLHQKFDVVNAGNVSYLSEIHDRMPVVVIEEAPYSLEIEKPQVPLVNNGILNLKVRATRKVGFDKPIRVLMMWRPNGVSSLGEQTITADSSECIFQLDANANAPAGKWNFVVMGEADGGNGRIYNASPFCEVTTAPAYLSAPEIPLVAVEQGKEALMVAKIEHLQPFSGAAAATLVGVPDTIQIEPTTITQESKDVAFKVKTDEKSPLGKQANLFVRVDVPVPGGNTTHRIALGSILRVDAPRKTAPPTDKPTVVAEAKPAKPKPEQPPKPLSRLEQLRQEASNP